MTPERWRQVKAIFDAALECTPASRAELIRQRCGNDRQLETEVESLLASDRETGFLLDSPLKLVAAVRSQAPGTRLGPYEILALIGAGGMGEVYKALDTRLDRAVAIKVLPKSFASDADRLRRFEIEAKAAGALNHPNILVVHDIGSDGGFPYLVSELLEGESLASRLKRESSASSGRSITGNKSPPALRLRTRRASATATSNPTISTSPKTVG
jgi:serine/threonine protein kinase